MREIKFRAWDSEKKQMARVSMLGEEEAHLYKVTGETWVSPKHYVAVIMQYTGLKDKNGVEIYEGDIIAKGYKNGLVTDSEPCEVNMGYLYDSDGYYSGGYLCWRVGEYESLADVCKFAEVKGNIYENPELLEVLK